MDEWQVFPREAVAVGSKGIEQGVARKKIPADERFKIAAAIIKEARDQVQMLMRENFIIDPDK
jgi:malate dehydrogenase (oxaloacetate-decarboxylating)